MSNPARPIHLTADDFIAWAMDRPDGEYDGSMPKRDWAKDVVLF